jgi:hypothetical protein
VIAVEGEGSAVAAQQLTQQAEIADGGFGGEERGGQDFSGGVVLQAEGGEARAAAFEPVVGRAIELDQFAFAGGSQAALAMSGSAAFAGRSRPAWRRRRRRVSRLRAKPSTSQSFSQRWRSLKPA